MDNENKYETGFTTPKDYFENFEDTLFSKMKEEELPKSTGFEIPEGYFETLEKEVLQKTIGVSKEPQVIPLYKRRGFIYAASIAASLAILISLVPFESTSGIDSVELADIENYLNEYEADYDSYDIASILSDEEANSLSFSSEIMTQQNLEDYLLETIDDPTLLIE